MDHVAIMNKKLGLIDHILSGQKTIETRWYKNKSAPYDKITSGDTIYFKNSGGPVCASAKVCRVEQFSNLNIKLVQKIVDQYGAKGLIDIQNKNVASWAQDKRYAILIWLKDTKNLEPFLINKKGFGFGCAWITINNIDTIREPIPAVAKRLCGSL